MDLVQPGFGLVFWTAITFLILLFILRKFAWKPILGALKEREDSIEEALKSADKAKEEMMSLQSKNESLIQEAKAERDVLLKEAREAKEKLISDAKKKASEEADKIIVSARESIEQEKMSAIVDLKSQMSALTINIAEKVLKSELAEPKKQQEFIEGLLKDIDLN